MSHIENLNKCVLQYIKYLRIKGGANESWKDELFHFVTLPSFPLWAANKEKAGLSAESASNGKLKTLPRGPRFVFEWWPLGLRHQHQRNVAVGFGK